MMSLLGDAIALYAPVVDKQEAAQSRKATAAVEQLETDLNDDLVDRATGHLYPSR